MSRTPQYEMIRSSPSDLISSLPFLSFFFISLSFSSLYQLFLPFPILPFINWLKEGGEVVEATTLHPEIKYRCFSLLSIISCYFHFLIGNLCLWPLIEKPKKFWEKLLSFLAKYISRIFQSQNLPKNTVVWEDKKW